MDFVEVQELLLALLPYWNRDVAKPFKQHLDKNVSLEMYYCIKTLQWLGGIATMTELAKYTKSQKQQMTQLVNKLVEQGLVERQYDNTNRRIINIKITDKANEYTNNFLKYDVNCFRPMLEKLCTQDIENLKQGLKLMIDVFSKTTV